MRGADARVAQAMFEAGWREAGLGRALFTPTISLLAAALRSLATVLAALTPGHQRVRVGPVAWESSLLAARR